MGEPDAVLVFDPSGFAKKGVKSVGVARQWCGRLGKVDNCQVGVSMAYVSRKEHAIVDTRLYLPAEWANDRGRREEAGVPESIAFQTRHGLALEMLAECGGRLPHAWVAGDDEMGRPSGFRQGLRTRNERYLLAVPSNLLIRDIEVTPPEYSGRGPHPKVPFTRLDRWCRALPEVAWTRIDVRDGEKGPLVIEVVQRRIQARTETGGTGPEELLFVTRGRQANGTYKHDYYFSNADPGTPLEELARVAKAEHRVEEWWPFTEIVWRFVQYHVCAYGYDSQRVSIGPPRHSPLNSIPPAQDDPWSRLVDRDTSVGPSGLPGSTEPYT